MAAGLIDEYRARLIWRPTRHLTDADAARADEILAALAPGLRYDQLARKAVAVAMKLDPEAFERGKEQARADRQRVQAGREESGNAFLSGRELAIEDALASKAHIDALAVALRSGGLPGTLQQLRVLAFNDLTQGRDPLDRPGLAGPSGRAATRPARKLAASPAATPTQGTAAAATVAARARCPATSLITTPAPAATARQAATRTDTDDSDDDASWDGCPDMPEWQHERRGTAEDDGDDHHDGAGVPSGPPAPFPALINLTVPAGTAYGWSSAPGEAGGWGLTDPGDTRRLLQAASLHPRTRWCFTLLGPDGTAAAHGCARGPHPWIPPPAAATRNSRRTRRPAGRRARRLPARSEHHLHPDRRRQLRSPQRRKPLCPQPQARAPGSRPHRDLPGARLRRAGLPQRPRPHPRLPRRSHRRMQPGPPMQETPPGQASPRLDTRTARTRHLPLDHTRRTHLHHQAHRL